MTIRIALSEAGVDVRNERFLWAERTLAGLAPEPAIQRVGALLSLCGEAHQVALGWALSRALGQAPEILSAQAILRHSTLREHARYWAMTARVLPLELARHLLRADPDSALQVWREQVLGGQAESLHVAWCDGGIQALMAKTKALKNTGINWWAWHQALPNIDLVSLPTLSLPEARADWQSWSECASADEAARRAPTWWGESRDGSVAALYGATSTLREREFARLVQLLCLLSGAVKTPAYRSYSLVAGQGMAVIEIARGLLCHQVQLNAAGLIEAVQIVAPTEWVFHPQGAVQQNLQVLRSQGQADQAPALVQAFDPCVGWTIEI